MVPGALDGSPGGLPRGALECVAPHPPTHTMNPARPLRLHTVALALAAAALSPGCAVITVAGAVVGTAASVAGTAIATTAKVTARVIEKTVDLVTGSDAPPPADAAAGAPGR